jgi:hypothetical protein
LNITCGAETNGRKALGFGAVSRIIVFMNLAVRSKRCSALVFKVELVAKDDFTRAVLGGYPIFKWEVI